jgi:hypothetical protein
MSSLRQEDALTAAARVIRAAAVDTAPSPPYELQTQAGEQDIALRWKQHGTVDYWVVYLDQLDGSDVVEYYTIEPHYRIEDLAPGEHYVEVAAWREGVPNPGPALWTEVDVLGLPEGAPHIPIVTDLRIDHESVNFRWISCNTADVQLRLIDPRQATTPHLAAIADERGSFTGLAPRTRYGVQARAGSAEGLWSPWCPAYWFDTEAVPARIDPVRQATIE